MIRRMSMYALVLLSLWSVAFAQTGKPAEVLGTWEGESTCTVRPSACHDEHVIYEVTQGAGTKLKMSADKVVNGERQNMGDLECSYDGKTLSCPIPRAMWAFEVSGSKLTGTLKLSDGSLFRKVEAARKDKSKN
jgi:hypothetical protein